MAARGRRQKVAEMILQSLQFLFMVLWRCYRLLTDKPLLPQLIALGTQQQQPISPKGTPTQARIATTLLALSAFAMTSIGPPRTKRGKTVPATHSQKQRTTGKIAEWPT